MPLDALIEKIQHLSPERQREVEDFVDFIRLREDQRALSRTAAAASAPAFANIWNNPEDDVYDAPLTSGLSSSSHSLLRISPRANGGLLSLSAVPATTIDVLTSWSWP